MNDDLAEKIYLLLLREVLNTKVSHSISRENARYQAREALRLAEDFHAEFEKNNAPHCF